MRTHLNICIPTFNRSDYLIEALNSFEKDTLEKYYNLINIYISDNASTDDTETAVSQYKSKTSLNIQYIKQKGNCNSWINFGKSSTINRNYSIQHNYFSQNYIYGKHCLHK